MKMTNNIIPTARIFHFHHDEILNRQQTCSISQFCVHDAQNMKIIMSETLAKNYFGKYYSTAYWITLQNVIARSIVFVVCSRRIFPTL